MNNNVIIDHDRPQHKLKQLTFIVYILYALSVFAGITAIAAIIVNYIKRDEVQGTYLATHFRWQIRTFWYGLLWAVVGFITTPILIGFLVWTVAGLWLIYRLVKGLLNLNDEKPMYPTLSV